MDKALDANLAGIAPVTDTTDFHPVARPELAPRQAIAPSGAGGPAFHNQMVNQQQTNVHVNVGMPAINVSMQSNKVPFVLRALWFVAVGWWLSALFITVGYLSVATIVLAPVGFWFLNRVPQAQTLRARNRAMVAEYRDGAIHFTESRTAQLPWYVRLVYFPFGLVIGAFWLAAAWLLSITLILLPLSVWMIDRSPTVITLQRN